jgi:hypothetical protein
MVTTWTYGDAHEAIAAWNRRASPHEHLMRKAAEALEAAMHYVPRPDIHRPNDYDTFRDLAAALRQRIGRG